MKFLKKVSTITVSAISAITLMASGFAGMAVVAQPVPVAAAPATSTSCPQDDIPETNIIYCGLAGTTSLDQMQSFKNYYDAGNDAHAGNPSTHRDIKQVYDAVFLKTNGNSNISEIFKSGYWFTGTAYDAPTSPVKGHTSVVVSNKVVATDLKITNRCPTMDPYCKPPSNYPALTGSDGKAITNVHMRDGNWFFAKDGNGHYIHNLPVLVHENKSGIVDFVVESKCGNAVSFTPVVPKQSLVCTSLTDVADTKNSLLYHFTVKAEAQNVQITSYKIDFGNGTVKPFSSSANPFSTDFTYTQNELLKGVTVTAFVNGTVTAGTCQVHIKITPPSTFACKQLAATLIGSSDDHRSYSFQATTTGTESAQSYQFVYTNTDGTVVTTTAQSSNASSHTYGFNLTNTPQDFTGKAYFVATSTSGKTTDKTDTNCQFSFTINSHLIVTGPASTFGIFAGASILGVGLHQFILRRKAMSL